MAEETPRLGLPIYESGSALHPTRVDFNARMDLIDDLAAIARQGDHEDRPMPGIRGLLWFSRDRRELYWDTGDEWEQVVPVGSSGANSVVRVGSPSSADEGESRRIARADHTHALPAATPSQPGAMSASDKTTLDELAEDIGSASWSGGAGTLVRRSSPNERIRVGDPNNASDATTRRYVDDQIEQAVADRIPFNTVPSSADLNNYTTPGDYAVSGNAPNNPRLSDGILEVKGSESMVMHRLTFSSAPIRIYVRSRIGGSWGSWREIPTEAA